MDEKHRIAADGVGGFLNPPTHPEHTLSVESYVVRRGRTGHEVTGMMSLSSAATSEWLPAPVRDRAREILAEWAAPPLDAPEVQDWIAQVLGYFRHCYRGAGAEPECWHAGHLEITKEPRPVEDHAGVHLIRQYYPAFEPTAANWAAAYWGKRPEETAR